VPSHRNHNERNEQKADRETENRKVTAGPVKSEALADPELNGLWLMISPFVLELVNRRVFRVGWEDFLLGFGIATFSLCRLSSGKGAAPLDFVTMALGLTTLLNPIVYHYFNVKAVAWNNLVVGSMVLILAIYDHRQNSESSKMTEEKPR